MPRYQQITEIIPKERTGLKANLFVHVDFDKEGKLIEVNISEKGKDGSTLDLVLTAVGDTLTSILANKPQN